MTRYTEYVERKRAEYGDKFSPACLSRKFISAFNAGDGYRIAVPNEFGTSDNPTWGYVGVTTGWRPAFILMKRRGQHGSSYVLSDTTPILAAKRR